MRYPLLLKPHLEHPIWSGKKLVKAYSKESDRQIGECWEMSTIKDRESIVANGIYKDRLLSEVLRENKDYTLKGSDTLDLLFKLIDTDDKLSIQVHPDDEFSKLYENQNGKTESWYILDCDKDAFIYLGFNKNLTAYEVNESIKNNTLEKTLNKIYVKAGDYFFIKSKTIHALGKGITVAEIQQSSAVTYRLYDFDRKDKNGNLRELHLEKGVKVLDLDRCDVKNLVYDTKVSEKDSLNLIQKSDFFSVYNAIIDKGLLIKTIDYMLITVVEGKGVINFDKNSLKVNKGNSIFIPAGYEIKVCGDLKILCNTPN